MLALVIVAILAGTGAAAWSRWSTTRLLRQGEEALAARHYARAKELLEHYLAIRPHDAHARLLAARTARRLRAYVEAREHLQRCRGDGGDPEAIGIEYALIDVQRGDERPVEELRRRAEKDDDLSLAILEVLIQHDLDTHQLWRALDGLNRYLERRPDDLQALLGRGFVWERVRSFRDALADYRKAVAAHPDSELARTHLAETLLIVGTPAEALTQYQWLEEKSPGRPEVRLGLARCRRRLGQPEEARKLLDELLVEAPANGGVLWERGELALDENDPGRAETWLRQAAELLPYDRRVHYALYRCLLERNRSTEAETIKARVDRLDADVQRLDRVCQEVLKHPDDATLRCEGGLIFLRNGERRAGLHWLQLALRLDPNCQAARQALAETPSPPPP